MEIKQYQLENQSISTYIVKVQPSGLLLHVGRQLRVQLVEQISGVPVRGQRQGEGCCRSRRRLRASQQQPPLSLLILRGDRMGYSIRSWNI